MNPVKFPEQNETMAKDQPQYRALPVCITFQDPNDEESIRRYTCKYELSDLEIQQIIQTRHMYFSQFGFGFHPILPQIDSPFLVCKVQYKKTVEGTYNFWVPKDQPGQFIELMGVKLENTITAILEATGNLKAEQLHFIEKPSMAVGVGGILTNMP